jgi:hypothetical protein
MAPKAPIGATIMHDDADHAEQRLVEAVDQSDNRLAVLAHRRQHRAEQDRQQQNAQQIAFGESADERLWNDVHQKVDRIGVLRRGCVNLDRCRVERMHVDVHAVAGPPDIDDEEADEQRDRGHDFEVDQRFQGDAADLLHLADAGDAVHHRAEDNRRNQHPDELDEAVAERMQVLADLREEYSDQDAKDHACGDLKRQVLVNRFPAQSRCADSLCLGHYILLILLLIFAVMKTKRLASSVSVPKVAASTMQSSHAGQPRRPRSAVRSRRRSRRPIPCWSGAEARC